MDYDEIAHFYIFKDPSPYRAVNSFHGAEIAVCSQINTKHTNTAWAECIIPKC